MRAVTVGGECHLLVDRAGEACRLYHPGAGEHLTVSVDAVAGVPEQPPHAASIPRPSAWRRFQAPAPSASSPS